MNSYVVIMSSRRIELLSSVLETDAIPLHQPPIDNEGNRTLVSPFTQGHPDHWTTSSI